MCSRCAFVTGVAATLGTPGLAFASAGEPQGLEIAMSGMRRIAGNVWLGRLTANVWIHTTTHVIDGVGYYPANGAIVVDGAQSLLIDTGWNDADTNVILEAWQRTGEPAIARALVTHFHFDRLGGIGALSKRGIPSFGNPLTIGLAEDNGLPAPRPLHDVEKRKQRLGRVEVFYPGEGHTIDNVIAWIPSDGVLFGGCLVKSTTAGDLGNIADANVAAWPATMDAVTRAYAPRHVIPGHGTIAGDRYRTRADWRSAPRAGSRPNDRSACSRRQAA